MPKQNKTTPKLSRSRPKSGSRQVKAPRHQESRREALLEAAALLFTTKGYASTSMRDIASAVDMLPGSIYYHFNSKEQLLLTVYHEGVGRFTTAIDQALSIAPSNSWLRLEAACVAHLTVLLDGGPFTRLVTPEFSRSFPDGISRELISERDQYEKRFENLIANLPLRDGTDKFLVKVSLFGSLNWSLTWYRAGKYSPGDIARSFVRFLQEGLEPN